MEDYEQLYAQALDWAKQNYPNANKYRLGAFGNSVVYLVTGSSVSLGAGPNLREHLVAWSLAGPKGSRGTVPTKKGNITVLKPDGSYPMPGKWDFEEACLHAAEICFSEGLPALAKVVAQQEYCFDDDPADLDALAELG